jgi:hypothetical protein
MFGYVLYELPKFCVEIVGQFWSGNILVVFHDPVDLREDARMKNDFHLDLLFLILLSKVFKEMPKEGLVSSSESLRLASASPLSGSENNAGRESKIWSASVALCGSGSSSASFSTETNVFIGGNLASPERKTIYFCPMSAISDAALLQLLRQGLAAVLHCRTLRLRGG